MARNTTYPSTQEKYVQAKRFVNFLTGELPLVRNSILLPTWIDDQYFWYRRQTKEGHEYRLVNAADASSEAAFDHVRLAKSLANELKEIVSASSLALAELTFSEANSVIEFELSDRKWRCDLKSKDYAVEELVSATEKGVLSPDREAWAFVRDHDLWVKQVATGEETQLTFDGEEFNAYAAPGMAWGFAHHLGRGELIWSPDSSKIFTLQLDRRNVKDFPIVDHLPDDSARPKVVKFKIAMPGDIDLEVQRLVIIDAKTGRQTPVQHPPVPTTRNSFGFFDAGLGWWSQDGNNVYFVDVDRGYKTATVNRCDAVSGSCKTVITETSETFLCLMQNQDEAPQFIPVAEQDQIIWFSERTGWGHYYLYDLTDGSLIRTLTSGEWNARRILRYVPEARTMVFQSSGRVPDRDPYYRDLVKLHLDEGEVVEILDGDVDHYVVPERISEMTALCSLLINREPAAIPYPHCGVSPDGNYILVTASRIDRPAVSVLVDQAGKEILTLEEADISDLPDDWNWPEPVCIKAADGVTDLFGVLYKPAGFDPNEKYPLLSHTFSQGDLTFVPKGSFQCDPFGGIVYNEGAALAQLGFAVFQLDGRGTPLRDRKFYDHAYGDMQKASDIADHAAGIRQLCETHSWIDAERIGSLGSASGGGPATVQGMLRHPDLFKVGASTFLHDSRDMSVLMGNIYEGFCWPCGEPDWLEKYAGNLDGKLLMTGGMMDAVTPPSTMFRLIEALQNENKDFDMLLLPKLSHGVSPYLTRKGWDYMVRHLLGEEPPCDFSLEPVDLGNALEAADSTRA